MQSKKCCGCGVVKSITDFNKDKARKDGLRAYCKICQRKRNLEYHYRNRESLLKYKKDYYVNNREYMLKCQKENYTNNRAKIQEYWVSPRGKLVIKARNARRRARKMGNTPIEKILTNEQLETLYETSTHCPYCGVELSTVTIHLDHVQPLSKGGQHTLDNVVLCCERCNKSKGAREPIEWMLEHGIEFGFKTKEGFISAYSKE